MNDLINRQAAIDYIKQQRARRFVACSIEEVMITILEELPTVEERKTGRWINHGQYADFFPHKEYRCSECDTPYLEIEMYYKYCPNCGARMVEE